MMWPFKNRDQKDSPVMAVDAAILKMEPGDILVVRTHQMISDETAARLKNAIEKRIPPQCQCMVLGDGMQLQVLRPPKDQAA